MAKKQTFEDKSRGKGGVSFINVKFVKTVKTDSGNYKFQEKFVKLDEVGKVTTLK